MNATFISKDQNWQDGTTTYWFQLDGADYRTGREFDNVVFGIVDEAGELTAVDSDNVPLRNEPLAALVARECKITEELVSL